MKIGFRIDHQEHVTIIQGEDRTLQMRFFDDESGDPIDLTGAVVKFEARSAKGGKQSVSSVALTFLDAAVDVTADSIAIPAHGLVEGQKLQLTTTGVLPAGLALATDYYVKVVDADHIQLSLTSGGAAVDITAAAGGGTHSVDSPLITLTGVAAPQGICSVPLDDVVTAALKCGAQQTPEIEYTISGVTRIVQLQKAWTVLEQTV